MTIQFKDVGRERFSEAVTFNIPNVSEAEGLSPDDIAALAFKVALEHLLSSAVQCVYNSEKNEGTIYAGLHVAGKFSVVKEVGISS